MSSTAYRYALILIALIFTSLFCYLVLPPLMQDFDLVGAFAAGFANPYAAGFSADTLSCWAVLAVWVIHERQKVPNGWVALVLGAVPGVAVGFVVYLLMRHKRGLA